MSLQPYEIDPTWPVVRDEVRDTVDDSAMETCEICNARVATKIVDILGVEGWACAFCR